MPGTSGDTPRARQLGAEIKHAREASKIGFRELARRLQISHSMLGHWEAGRRAPSVEDLAGVLGVIGVAGAERDRLLDLARDAADPNWVAPGIDRQLAALVEYERTAESIVEVNTLLVPGLLQTGDYARAIMLGAGTGRGEADQRVLLRLGRREVLTRRAPVNFLAIVGEYALRHPPCDERIMADQLRHLLHMAKLDNVTIVALPLKAPYSPALEGPFVLVDLGSGRPVVQLEHYRSTTTITDSKDVEDYQAAVDKVRGVAMSPAETAGLIADLADGMERTT